MLPFRVLPRSTLDIRADLPPLGLSRTPTDICIPFLFNTPVIYCFRRCSTGDLLSPFPSFHCGLFPFQRAGIPPSLNFISRSVAQSALYERTNCALLRNKPFVCHTCAKTGGRGEGEWRTFRVTARHLLSRVTSPGSRFLFPVPLRQSGHGARMVLNVVVTPHRETSPLFPVSKISRADTGCGNVVLPNPGQGSCHQAGRPGSRPG
jgi:hypothetical protein